MTIYYNTIVIKIIYHLRARDGKTDATQQYGKNNI